MTRTSTPLNLVLFAFMAATFVLPQAAKAFQMAPHIVQPAVISLDNPCCDGDPDQGLCDYSL